jgi:hypothetical protein
VRNFGVADHASISLNKPRTVPTYLVGLGNSWAKGSRKVLNGPPDTKCRMIYCGCESCGDAGVNSRVARDVRNSFGEVTA